jgi:hypothetical protein
VLANRRRDLQRFIKDVRVWEGNNRDTIRRRRKAMAAKQCAHASGCTDCAGAPPGPVGGTQVWSKKLKAEEESVDLCQNFRRLLWFWQQYYSHCNCDRYSLECSSGVKFGELQSVVEMLCADDGAATSLLGSPIVLPRLLQPQPGSERANGQL